MRILFQEELKEGNPPARIASRLANEAILYGDIDAAKDLANRYSSSDSLMPPARKLLNELISGQSENLPTLRKRKDFEVELSKLKKAINQFPRDPMLWLERARIYTILSQKDQAKDAAKVALSLAPSNRYIVRSAVRLFMHYDEWDAAWHYSYRAFSDNPDPWLKSLTISVGSRDEVRQKLPAFKGRIVEGKSNQELFSFSELNAVIGNLELRSGNDIKAKKLFRYAWKNPSSTVISHGVWVVTTKLKGLAKSVQFDLSNNVQGLAYRHMNSRDYHDAIPVLNQWLLEEPYSSEPHKLLYNAYINLRMYDDAVDVAECGYDSNPEERGFLNQIAYAYLRMDSKKAWEKASLWIRKMEDLFDLEGEPVPMATKGMYEILTGNVEFGVELYRKSLKIFSDSKKREDAMVCGANLLMNIIRINKGVPESAYRAFHKNISKAKSNYTLDVLLMLEHVAEQYKSNILNDKSVEKYLEL